MRRGRVPLTVLVLGLVGAVGGVATFSSFSSTTADGGNSFAAGTVLLGDNDAGAAMLGLTLAKPSDADTSCIRLTYSGTLPATVRLYATVTGSLAPYLTLTVTRGTDSSSSFDSCAGFAPDATDYTGSGPGVLYSGSLSSFPASYAAGIVDPLPGTPETWTANESHSYRLAVTLANDTAAQGLSSSASFSWEAQNL